jgi:hypothetical protein
LERGDRRNGGAASKKEEGGNPEPEEDQAETQKLRKGMEEFGTQELRKGGKGTDKAAQVRKLLPDFLSS